MNWATAMQRSMRLARTARYLHLGQVYDRIRRRIVPVRPDLSPAPPSRRIAAPLVEPPNRPSSFPRPDRFLALNVACGISSAAIWNDPVRPKLWLYNLHYFNGLLAPDANALRTEHAALIARWIRENPPARGTGWEPYPISLRIVNWIKWALLSGALSEIAHDSLATQMRFLARSVEYHLRTNHILANAKALFCGGLYFDGPEAESWFEQGRRILKEELAEQILADGGHFELSPTYHAILCEDILDLINFSRAYGRHDDLNLGALAARMIAWLRAMTRPDGLPPLFNDSAYGVAPLLSVLEDYARRLGILLADAAPHFVWLAASGYARVAQGDYVLFADLGALGPDYNPGHGHCDMLNFELVAKGRPVIVDTGTSTYEAGTIRMSERGTAAHNTVQVGDAEQSEIWAAFRVGRRARLKVHRVDRKHLEASHDGFASRGVRHRRLFKPEPDRLVIEDFCEGTGEDQLATARLHFHPEIALTFGRDMVQAGPLRISSTSAAAMSQFEYHYAPEFGLRIPAHGVAFHFRRRLETVIAL